MQVATPGMTLLRETLVTCGITDDDRFSEAAVHARLKQAPLEGVLLAQGIIGPEQLRDVCEILYGVPILHLDDLHIDRGCLDLLPREMAARYKALPLYVSGRNRLTIGMVDPLKIEDLDHLSYHLQKDLRVVRISEEDFERGLKLYERKGDVQALLTGYSGDPDLNGADARSEEKTDEGLGQMADDAPAIRLSTLILTQAIESRASDIHLEPGRKEGRVRYRLDGSLRDVMVLPMPIFTSLVSRLKLMADMDITERRLPQDGNTEAVLGGRHVEFRLASSPVLFGEKLVLRIIDFSTSFRRLEELGYSDADQQRMHALLDRPHGMLLVTGPTGSGKRTTLYAWLEYLNTPDRNLQTIEDTVQRHLDRVSQLQVSPRIGLTAATALRSFLRQDADVILLGEMRDRETARIACDAALTGHLMLSTLHTHDAVGALTRLVDMGVPGYIVASSVRGVVGQRLVKRLCPRCAVKEPLGGDDEGSASPFPDAHRASGCSHCGNSGYKGRLVVAEVLTMTRELARGVVQGRSPQDLLELARLGGMVTMREDAGSKAGQGLTSPSEVQRLSMSLDL